jgi:hypothetical protein
MEAEMSLFLNKTGHWQLPDGFELHSGDAVEIYLDGQWIPAEINYRPPNRYQIRFENGQTMEISEDLDFRICNRISMRKSPKTIEKSE